MKQLKVIVFGAVLALSSPATAANRQQENAGPQNFPNQSYRIAQSVSCGGTCGKARNCRDAVYLWCVCGYSRADRDKDGVPCEKLCGQSSKRNVAKVQAIMKDLGCR